MDKFKILSGNACFLVRNKSTDMSKKDFKDYLKREGFEEFNCDLNGRWFKNK